MPTKIITHNVAVSPRGSIKGLDIFPIGYVLMRVAVAPAQGYAGTSGLLAASYALTRYLARYPCAAATIPDDKLFYLQAEFCNAQRGKTNNPLISPAARMNALWWYDTKYSWADADFVNGKWMMRSPKGAMSEQMECADGARFMRVVETIPIAETQADSRIPAIEGVHYELLSDDMAYCADRPREIEYNLQKAVKDRERQERCGRRKRGHRAYGGSLCLDCGGRIAAQAQR